MIKILVLFLLTTSTYAYVPTVESLFRHGTNPEITHNAVSLSAKITPINPFAEKSEQAQGEPLWIRWVFHVAQNKKVKLSQLVYRSPNMNQANLVNKVFLTEFSPASFDQSPEMGERGLLFGLINSLVQNDGSFLVTFLKNRGVDVRLNEEIINIEKKSLLERYKSWLIKTKGGRVVEGEESPLNPNNLIDKEKNQQIMEMPMYANTEQVELIRFQSEATWKVTAENFEALVSDANREIKQISLKHPSGESEIFCKDYIKYNGVHGLPRQVVFKNYRDQYFNIDISGVRYFNEKPQELVQRLKKYEEGFKQPKDPVIKPNFIY
jgi:hypothetical protein